MSTHLPVKYEETLTVIPVRIDSGKIKAVISDGIIIICEHRTAFLEDVTIDAGLDTEETKTINMCQFCYEEV